MINILTPSAPHEDLCKFVGGPFNDEWHYVPKKVRHLSSGMPYGGKVAVYDPKVELGITVFHFVEIVKPL